MTFVVTVLIGAGILFVASALDDTPLIQTFQKIISNQPINWTGASSSPTSGTSAATGPSTGTTVPSTGGTTTA
jgi:hypothetical protein